VKGIAVSDQRRQASAQAAASTERRFDHGGYVFTRSPDAADLSMAAITSWRRTASAKSGTVCLPLSMSAANAA
jgi:glutathione S-transferase